MQEARMSSNLRNQLDSPGIIVAPCAYDCVSAKLIEAAGFKAVLHGNFNGAASLLGVPDVGLITMSESVEQVRRMSETVNIPLICDVDDGYGGVLNIARTTHEVIRAGAAGMYIEDQVAPKRCPSLGGNEVISLEDMVRKLKVVSKVRTDEDPDFVLVARTNAGRVVSLDDAIKRSIAYAEAGADLVFFDPGYTDEVLDEFKAILEQVKPHVHLIANMTENVGRPMLTTEELAAMGFKMVIYPLTLILTVAAAMEEMLAELMAKGTTKALADKMMHVRKLGDLMGMDKVRKLDELFNDGD